MTQKKTGGRRDLTVRVKTARGRKKSSTKWLQRQLNDPYVTQARQDGYRSRAAYKLIELNEKFDFLKPNMRVVDLGAAPGGWTQVAAQYNTQQIIGIDLLEIEPIPGADLIQMDFQDDQAPEIICEKLGGKANLVMSDMAANTTGHPPTDHIRIIALCELAYDFAKEILAPGGTFLCKVLKGGTENNLLTDMKQNFAVVKHAKPNASRKDSAESYVVAIGYKQ